MLKTYLPIKYNLSVGRRLLTGFSTPNVWSDSNLFEIISLRGLKLGKPAAFERKHFDIKGIQVY